MKQYNQPGSIDEMHEMPPKVSAEKKHIQSVEQTVKQLQENFAIQQQEISRLHREVNRLKNAIDDVITVVRNRG